MAEHPSRRIAGRWSKNRVRAWARGQPWRVGCNYIPANAINQLEMWQEESFDEATIDRELGWAEALGFNALRVYLHDLLWTTDAEGFKRRIERFLAIAERHGMVVMPVFFDDCWGEEPKAGRQPDPVPGVHGSGWVQSPGLMVLNAPGRWDHLKAYVQDILRHFADDPRILLWDLFNEAGHNKPEELPLRLLEAVFHWAREIDPSQPLTAPLWWDLPKINDFLRRNVDVVTFHHYVEAPSLRRLITRLKRRRRPVLCTEWLRRPRSTVQTHLPIFRRSGVGCFNWGLVSGKTQTIYGWGSKEGAAEPAVWFHDLLREDGSPFDEEERLLFQRLTDQGE